MKMFDFLFSSEGFFVYLNFSVLGNAIYSLFIFFYNEKRNNLRKIFVGASLISIISTTLMISHVGGWWPLSIFSVITSTITSTILIWCCIFVPQLLIHFINTTIMETDSKGARWKAIALRLMLTVILPTCLLILLT